MVKKFIALAAAASLGLLAACSESPSGEAAEPTSETLEQQAGTVDEATEQRADTLDTMGADQMAEQVEEAGDVQAENLEAMAEDAELGGDAMGGQPVTEPTP